MTRSTHRDAVAPAGVQQSAPGMPSPAAPWPYFADEEIEAAVKVLRSGKVNYWTGDEGKFFEKEFAEFTTCKYALALANGTVALEAALKVLGIGLGDDVVTTARTFIASASCAVASAHVQSSQTSTAIARTSPPRPSVPC